MSDEQSKKKKTYTQRTIDRIRTRVDAYETIVNGGRAELAKGKPVGKPGSVRAQKTLSLMMGVTQGEIKGHVSILRQQLKRDKENEILNDDLTIFMLMHDRMVEIGNKYLKDNKHTHGG